MREDDMSARKMVTIARGLTRRQAMAGGTAAIVAAPFVIRSGLAQGAAVNIGVIQPLSGANAQFGINCRNGIEFVADTINAAGGIKALSHHSLDRRPTPDHPERAHCGSRRIRVVVDAGNI